MGASFKLFDKEYPLVCTVEALQELTETVGGDLNRLTEPLESGDSMVQLQEAIRFIYSFMKAGRNREIVRQRMLGEKTEETYFPSFDEFKQCMEISDLRRMMEAVKDTITESRKQTVEIIPEKNAEATRSE